MDIPTKISFTIKDTVLGDQLSPSNLTLPLLSEFIDQVSSFLRGKSRQDLIEVRTGIKSGSLAVVVENQAGALDSAFKDYIVMQQNYALENLDPVRAQIIEQWQNIAKNNTERTYELFFGETKVDGAPVFTISSSTNYTVRKDVWVNTELYVYGKIFDLGGKSKPNVHIELDNGKTIKIGTDTSMLIGDNTNRLYRKQLVRIKAAQNIITRELRNEQLISFEYYNPVFDQEGFDKIAKKAKVAWKSITTPTEWVDSLRGDYA